MTQNGFIAGLAMALILGMGAVALAEPPKPSADAESLLAKTHDDDPYTKVIDTVDLQNAPITDVVEFLQQKVPGFQAVIVRDPAAENFVPTVPNMRLKKVTLGQVIAIVSDSCPAVEISPVESEVGKTIFVCKIHASRTGGHAGGAVTIPGVGPQSILKVYSLFSLIETIESQTPLRPAATGQTEEKGRKQANVKPSDSADNPHKAALNAVLSLVKATLAEVDGPQVSPVVQVHEETLTLILKGTYEQISAVDQAFAALKPPSHDNGNDELRLAALRAANQKASEENERLKNELEQARLEQVHIRVEEQNLQSQLDALKINAAVKKANESKE